MISKLSIAGFKSLKDVSLELAPVNILIGANGSGKTNILGFFDFLKAVARQGLEFEVNKAGGVNSFLHHGRQTTPLLSWELILDSSMVYEVELTPGAGDFFLFSKEIALGTQGGTGRMERGRESGLQMDEMAKHASQEVTNALASIATYHFHDTGTNSPLNAPSDIGLRQARLLRQGENIAGFLYNLKSHAPKRYQLLLATLRSIAPYFRDFAWQELGQHKASLTWFSRYSEQEFRFTDLSDGTQRFVALCCVFLQDNLPGTIVIDEPELGLHPTAIAKLVGLMRSAVGRGAQVIAATQSTEFVDYFEPEEVVTVDQRLGATTLQRLDGEALATWLEQYSLGNLWSQHILERAQVAPRHG